MPRVRGRLEVDDDPPCGAEWEVELELDAEAGAIGTEGAEVIRGLSVRAICPLDETGRVVDRIVGPEVERRGAEAQRRIERSGVWRQWLRDFLREREPMIDSGPNEAQRLGERLAIHVEKGELALARRLLDEATLGECVGGEGRRQAAAVFLGETRLPPKLVEVLARRGILTVGDLLRRTPHALSKINGLGEGGLAAIYDLLAELGLRRGE